MWLLRSVAATLLQENDGAVCNLKFVAGVHRSWFVVLQIVLPINYSPLTIADSLFVTFQFTADSRR
ncbi:MAG: hypothetical protein ICV84_23765 [Flavisolibacter sp.]|nr:hypothetical protein [Flavisolibacter sp.]MBD0352761.1 hypothetical protein [Flavisolibacter sp.]